MFARRIISDDMKGQGEIQPYLTSRRKLLLQSQHNSGSHRTRMLSLPLYSWTVSM